MVIIQSAPWMYPNEIEIRLQSMYIMPEGLQVMTDRQAQNELAYAALLLERQLDSYQKLHEEEMAALRKALTELKRRILSLPTVGNPEMSETLEVGELLSAEPDKEDRDE